MVLVTTRRLFYELSPEVDITAGATTERGRRITTGDVSDRAFRWAHGILSGRSAGLCGRGACGDGAEGCGSGRVAEAATELGLFASRARRHAVAPPKAGKKRRRTPPCRVLISRALPHNGLC